MKDVKVERRSPSPTQVSEDNSQNQPQSKPQLTQDNVKSIKNSLGNGVKDLKLEQRSTSTFQTSEGSSQNKPLSRSQLVIPAANPKISQPIKMSESGHKASSGSGSRASYSSVKLKGDTSHRAAPEQDAVETQAKGTKRKFGKTFTWYNFVFSI